MPSHGVYQQEYIGVPLGWHNQYYRAFTECLEHHLGTLPWAFPRSVPKGAGTADTPIPSYKGRMTARCGEQPGFYSTPRIGFQVHEPAQRWIGISS